MKAEGKTVMTNFGNALSFQKTFRPVIKTGAKTIIQLNLYRCDKHTPHEAKVNVATWQ